MSFFHKSNKNAASAEEKPHKPSVRELQARAYERWVGEGNAEPKQRNGSFEQERERRRQSATEDLKLRS